MVQQCREFRPLLLPGNFAYTFESLRRTDPALCPVCGFISSIPFGYLPSLHGLHWVFPFVRPFLRYYEGIRLLIGVSGGIVVPFSALPDIPPSGTDEISQLLRK